MICDPVSFLNVWNTQVSTMKSRLMHANFWDANLCINKKLSSKRQIDLVTARLFRSFS